MITATRMRAQELEDGTLEVVMHVHERCKAEFFAAFPKPGAWAALAPAEKPPTQGAAPETASTGATPQVGIGPPPHVARAMQLVKNPIFQAFIEVADPVLATAFPDAERAAFAYISKHCKQPEALPALETRWRDWAAKKGYTIDV